MCNQANTRDNSRSSRFDEGRATIQLFLPEGQSINVQMIKLLPDGAGLSSRSKLSLVHGHNVCIMLTPSTRRYAQVLGVEQVGKDYLIGVQWKSAVYRDAARARAKSLIRLQSDDSEQFYAKMSARFYTMWQLLDAGRLNVLAGVAEQLEREVIQNREYLVEICQEVRCTIKTAATHERIACVLDQLCRACLQDQFLSNAIPPDATPVMMRDRRHITEMRREFLGTSTWVLGSVAVLSGYLLTMI